MKLYFNPRSRAVVSKWMLDECNADYELVHVDLATSENKKPEFLQINPAGKLPALVDGDARVFENAAICLYLADRFPEARLAPALDAPERGRYLSWMVFSSSQLDPAIGDALLDENERHPSRGWIGFAEARQVVERELGDGPYLFGDWFTAADVVIGSLFAWKRMFSGGASDGPIIDAYVDRLAARPKGLKLG